MELKGLNGIVKDEQIVINTNKEIELHGDLKFKITQKNNDLGILKKEKCISTFCDVFRIDSKILIFDKVFNFGENCRVRS